MRRGKKIPDVPFRDTENIPLAEEIDDYKDDNNRSIPGPVTQKYLLEDGDWSIVVLPFAEQERLISYIEDKILPIDHLITQREALIADLLDYKQFLIYEAVTGQTIQ